jgi:murein L,D-transpeptidase YcbB/YkuD
MKKATSLLLSLLFINASIPKVFGQITAERMEHYIAENNISQHVEASRKTNIVSFYKSMAFKTAWVQSENSIDKNNLFVILKQASIKGLVENDYQYNFIQALKNKSIALKNENDSIEADIRITDAALHFYSDIVFGNAKPAFSYDGIGETLACVDIPSSLASALKNKNLNSLVNELTPSLKEIAAIENLIEWIHAIVVKADFKEIIITSPKVSLSNKPLVEKLFQLGVLSSLNNPKKADILDRVIEAQSQFNLPADGVIRSDLLEEMNVPLTKRLLLLKLALNHYRWLCCFSKNRATIVVNIPAAYLKVHKNNAILLEMRMVVGKTSTPTPTLLSTVNEVVLYPYWNVPKSIATKELLPLIKKNSAYLENRGFQVLNSAGKVVLPNSINWRALSTHHFPYTLRQSTGCDNALGLLKLNFHSPDGVYLHDTPSKNSFALNRRFLSHGCMRMEKPIELGHLVLEQNFLTIDTLIEKGCLKNQVPLKLPADVQMPVLVWYNPVGIDNSGRVIFFQDVYKKFNTIR